MNRRTLLKSAGMFAVPSTMTTATEATQRSPSDPGAAQRPTLCLFSKPLQNRSVAEIAALIPELGFTAVDLTCRSGGHVLPDRAADDLPRAQERLAAAGVSIAMITTEIVDARGDHAETILRTAGQLGIRHAKLGYYSYGDLNLLDKTLAEVKSRLRDVAALCREHGVRAGFHNHAGSTVGAAMWDVWELIADLPEEVMGAYFDLRHATVEGGDAAWRINLHRMRPRVVMVAVKDFVWRRSDDGAWKATNVPLGEGMVRSEEALRILQRGGYSGPVSLHMEYGKHGVPAGSPEDRDNLTAIRRDGRTLRDQLQRAGLL
jgi:sugar phosphate isomerase/epimerase